MKMNWSTNPRGISLVLSVLLLAACANNQAKTAGSGGGNNSTEPVVVSTSAPPPAPEPLPVQPPVVIPNPSTISFEKMSTTLDGKGKKGIAQLADRAKISSKVTVTGFCDSRQVGNSTDAAVARAIAVRDELLAHGVVPANIRVKFATNIKNKHVAEVSFN